MISRAFTYGYAIPAMCSREFQALFTFADGQQHSCMVRPVSHDEQFTLARDGFEFVKKHQPLAEWLTKNDKMQERWSSDQEKELGQLLDKMITARYGCQGYEHVLTSTIYRNADATSYTNHVHRDLDETACSNLKLHGGYEYFFNAWVPRRAIVQHPLALALPDTVRVEDNAPLSLGFGADRTGLKYWDGLRFIYMEDMDVGDVILFRADKIYHASFFVPDRSEAPRFSADLRLYYKSHNINS